jgi:sialic acid synthase SpsE
MITLPSGREIGEGKPVFIIAEIGSNWQTLDDCLTSIRGAKAAGADAVKFQAFTWNALYGHGGGESCSLPLDWLPRLKAEADKQNIEFMCSAFSPELVDAVDPFVNVHKVASAECTHVRMLERLHEIGKPVFLSTGAHGLVDIEYALAALGPIPLVLLYCEAAYPARHIDTFNVWRLRDEFGHLVGFSDHTTDVALAPKTAFQYQACVIEKHVTFIDADTPDSPHSLSGGEFKRMVDVVRGADIIPLGPTPGENAMIARHNRRLIATQDIAEGVPLQEGKNFGIYRSLKDEAHAFSPFLIDEVNGCVAKRAIKAGDGIGPGDV